VDKVEVQTEAAATVVMAEVAQVAAAPAAEALEAVV
jgi:hypothetical protein